MRRKFIISAICVIATVVLFVFIFRTDFAADIYSSAYKWLGKKSGIDPYWPDLRTNNELLFDGYLGIFFRFDQFGILNWLVIPLVFYFLINVKKKERWEIALCLSLCITCMFICFMGYGWYRYQLTIFPLLLAIIFLFGWQVLREMNNRVASGIILICICLLFGYSYSLRDTYAYYWKGNVGDGNNGERFPYKLIEYVNKNLGKGAEIIEYEAPILSYHAGNRKNIHAQGDDKYILSRNIKVTGNYDLVYEDQKYQLYKKEDNIDILYNNFYKSAYTSESLLDNGSFEQWKVNLPVSWNIYGSGSIQKEKNDVKIGNFAVKITGDRFNFYQNVPLSRLAADKIISCFVWMKSSVPDKYGIEIYDGIDSSVSERHTGDGKWQILKAIHSINPQATSIELRVVQASTTGGLNDVVYVDGVLLFSGEYFSPSQFHMEHCRQ